MDDSYMSHVGPDGGGGEREPDVFTAERIATAIGRDTLAMGGGAGGTLGDGGVARLCGALAAAPASCTTLDLRSNNIKEAGMLALARFITSGGGAALRTLVLEWNSLGLYEVPALYGWDGRAIVCVFVCVQHAIVSLCRLWHCVSLLLRW
jgi:hypothetical protein